MFYLVLTLAIASFIVFLLLAWFLLCIILQAISWYGVPYVPTPDYKVWKLLCHMGFEPKQKFLDIGCGNGKIVEAVKQKFPEVECTGIENSLFPYYLAKRKQKKSSQDYIILKGNFFRKDISQYDIIYCYLLPLLMKKVWKKIISECQPGTLLYSSAFEIPGVEMKERLSVWDGKWVYVYEV